MRSARDKGKAHLTERLILASAAIGMLLVLSACGFAATQGSAAGTADATSGSSPVTLSSVTSAVLEPGELTTQTPFDSGFSLEAVEPYSGAYISEVNGNKPYFSESDLKRAAFEQYSDLDSLGRCGTTFALVGNETMPNSSRGSIGMIKPSGWRISEYEWIDGKYLFNRCHLIAFSLAGENDNPLNLITGTRSLNAQAMLPYEEKTVRYIEATGNHVLYRVTPVFEGENPIASGVLMEAESVEDQGNGVCFCVWCYNVEPGVVIDYATGDNRAGDPVRESYASDASGVSGDGPGSAAGGALSGNSGSGSSGGLNASSIDSSSARSGDATNAGTNSDSSDAAQVHDAHDSEVRTYVLNTNTRRFHYPECPSVSEMKDKNKQEFEGTRDELIEGGYQPCGDCRP